MMSVEFSRAEARTLFLSLPPQPLTEIIARAAGTDQRITSYLLRLDQELRGCKGYRFPKFIAEIDYIKDDRRHGTVAMLVKYFRGWAGRGEFERYQWLASRGVPLPDAYGAVPGPNGDQVLMLELLPDVGYDIKKPADRAALLCTLARLHAVDARDATSSALFSDWHWRDAASTISRLVHQTLAHAQAGDLGLDIAALWREGKHFWKCFDARLAEWIAATEQAPVGLVHSDASPQNTGRRAGESVLRLFDLHTMKRGCIFGDIAKIFDLSGGELSAAQQQEAMLYLDELATSGGPQCDIHTFVELLAVLKPLMRAEFFDWSLKRCLDGKVDWTSDTEEGKRTYRGWMLRDLKLLLADMTAGADGREARPR